MLNAYNRPQPVIHSCDPNLIEKGRSPQSSCPHMKPLPNNSVAKNSLIRDRLGHGPRSYRIGALITGILTIFQLYQAQPLLIKLFVPFPPLSEAQVITGRIEVVGHEHPTRNGTAPPRYFIVTPSGRQEFFCGLTQAERNCFLLADEDNQNAEGTIWLHPTFGVIQYSLQRNRESTRKAYEESMRAIYKDDPKQLEHALSEPDNYQLTDKSDYRTAKYFFDHHDYGIYGATLPVWFLAFLYSLYRAFFPPPAKSPASIGKKSSKLGKNLFQIARGE